MEPDFLQDSTDLNHLNCKIGKCQDGISDTLDMTDFEPMIRTPSIEQKGKSRRRLRERILSKQRRSKLGKAILLCTYTVPFHCRFCFAIWHREGDIFSFVTEHHLDVIKRVWNSGDVVQLVESLPNVEEALDPLQNQIKGAWWCAPLVSALGRWRPEELKLKVSLG